MHTNIVYMLQYHMHSRTHTHRAASMEWRGAVSDALVGCRRCPSACTRTCTHATQRRASAAQHAEIQVRMLLLLWLHPDKA